MELLIGIGAIIAVVGAIVNRSAINREEAYKKESKDELVQRLLDDLR